MPYNMRSSRIANAQTVQAKEPQQQQHLTSKRPLPLRQASSSSTSSLTAYTSKLRLQPTSSASSISGSTLVGSSSSSPTSLKFLKNSSRSSVQNGHVTMQQMEAVIKERQRQNAQESALRSLYELEYRDEVIAYMHETELTTMASVELIDMQPELQWYMRPFLLDFLIEIHAQYRLRPETLFLAINIIDRYVSKRIVYKKHYQLVGCAALWIAAKFEDSKDRIPQVEDLCQVCCAAYDQSAFIQMEGHVLQTINWHLGHPTAEAWLRISCAPTAQVTYNQRIVPGPGLMEDKQIQDVARFLMENTLFHREFIAMKSSDVADGCLLLARWMLRPASQKPICDNEGAKKCAELLDHKLATEWDKVSATVIKKYSPSFYSRAPEIVLGWYEAGNRFEYYECAVSSSMLEQGEDSFMCSGSTSSCSEDGSDFDQDEEEYEEDMEHSGLSSEPITPTTSVGDISSDPFEAQMKNASSSPLGNGRPKLWRNKEIERQRNMSEDSYMDGGESEDEQQWQLGKDVEIPSWQINVVSPQ